MDWAVRGYLVFAAIQGCGIGLTGFIVPAEMQIPLRLTPLNARFVAALYIAGGVGVLFAAATPRRRTARLFCVGFGLATVLILGVTLLHWSDFMSDELPHRPVWIFDYVVDPLLALVLVPIAGLWPPRHGAYHPLTNLLWVETVVFGALGLLLLLVPQTAAIYWPWTLPPVAGQIYGCFLLTFAVGAALAARETEARAIRDFLIASVSLCVLVLLASAIHFDRFKPEPVTTAWFVLFGAGVLAFGAGVVVSLRRTAIVGAPARA
jgi:hypothetical protein